MRLRDFADAWLASQTQLKPRKRELHATQLTNHIYTRPKGQPLGRSWVHQVREDDISALIAEMRKAGYSGLGVSSLCRQVRHAAALGRSASAKSVSSGGGVVSPCS